MYRAPNLKHTQRTSALAPALVLSHPHPMFFANRGDVGEAAVGVQFTQKIQLSDVSTYSFFYTFTQTKLIMLSSSRQRTLELCFEELDLVNLKFHAWLCSRTILSIFACVILWSWRYFRQGAWDTSAAKT